MDDNKLQKVKTKKPRVSTDAVQDDDATEPKQVKKEIVAKEIDPTQYVTVRNGFHGRLVYRSKRTGESFIWDGFGAEQEIELRELKNAKNSNKKFFINNWFMFDEDWIPEYLGVRQFYKHAISIDHFDDIFQKKPEKLKQLIAELSSGQKQSVAYRARELIAAKQIDSISVISTLEEALGIELIER